MSDVSREMTLDEWVNELPPKHGARTEFFDLRIKVRDLAAGLAEVTKRYDATCAELADWRDGAKRVMAEDCGIEKHCTCVPTLRRELAGQKADKEEAEKNYEAMHAAYERKRSEVARLQEALDGLIAAAAIVCGFGAGTDEIDGLSEAIAKANELTATPAEGGGDEPRRCASCGKPEDNHPYRHPFKPQEFGRVKGSTIREGGDGAD